MCVCVVRAAFQLPAQNFLKGGDIFGKFMYLSGCCKKRKTDREGERDRKREEGKGKVSGQNNSKVFCRNIVFWPCVCVRGSRAALHVVIVAVAVHMIYCMHMDCSLLLLLLPSCCCSCPCCPLPLRGILLQQNANLSISSKVRQAFLPALPEPECRLLLLTFANQNHRRDLYSAPLPLPTPLPMSGWQKLPAKTNHTLLLRANCQCADKKLCTKRHKLCCSIFCALSSSSSSSSSHTLCLFSLSLPFCYVLLHVQHLHSLCIVYWTEAAAAATPRPARSLLKGKRRCLISVAYFLGLSKLGCFFF